MPLVMKKPSQLMLFIVMIATAAVSAAVAAPSADEATEKKVYSVSKDLDALQSLLSEYRNKGDSTAVGITLYHIGRYYNQNSEYIKSINAYRQAMEAHRKNNDEYEIVRTVVGLSTSERRIGAYTDAASDLLRGIQVLENSYYVDTDEGKRHHSYLYNGLGNVYKYLNNGDEAEKYFRLSLDYDKMIGNYTGMAMNWSTIGSIYEYRSMYDSAAVMYQRSIDYNKRGRSTSGVGISLNRLGQLTWELGDIDKSEEQFLAAYDSLSKAKDRWNLAKSTMSLASIYIEKGDIKKAKKYLDESYELAGGRHSFGHDQEIHSLKAMLLAKQGNYKDAYSESMVAMAYKDSSAAQKDEQEIAQSRINFVEEQARQEMNRILKEKDHESSLKRWILFAGILSTTILLIFLVILYRYWLLQKKHTKRLAELNDVKNKFFSLISHDLKNPLIAQRNTLKQLEELINYAPREVVKSQIAELAKSSDATLDLVKNLLDWSRLQAGKMKYEPIRVDLHNVCEDTIDLLKEQLTQKNITVRNNIPADTIAFCDLNMISTVLRNLSSNAIKYSNTDSTIEFNCKDAENGRMWISVKDHGIGMTKEKAEALLKGLDSLSSAGTLGEQGTGLGLAISREFIGLAGGDHSLETEPDKGSEFSFTVLKG